MSRSSLEVLSPSPVEQELSTLQSDMIRLQREVSIRRRELQDVMTQRKVREDMLMKEVAALDELLQTRRRNAKSKLNTIPIKESEQQVGEKKLSQTTDTSVVPLVGSTSSRRAEDALTQMRRVIEDSETFVSSLRQKHTLPT